MPSQPPTSQPPTSPTPAERLDAALSALLADEPRRDPALPRAAALLKAALSPVPPSAGFEERLARRLTGGGLGERLRQRAVLARRELTPARLIAAGAVSSAAVGVTVLAVWRTGGRRQAGHGR